MGLVPLGVGGGRGATIWTSLFWWGWGSGGRGGSVGGCDYDLRITKLPQ